MLVSQESLAAAVYDSDDSDDVPESAEAIRQRLGSQRPRWEPDSASNSCAVCGEGFGTLRRKHHCRKCGRLVCGECSRGRQIVTEALDGQPASVVLDPTKPVRACNDCILHVARRKKSGSAEAGGTGTGMGGTAEARGEGGMGPRRVHVSERRLISVETHRNKGRSNSMVPSKAHRKKLY